MSASSDGGVTFSRPRAISPTRWALQALARAGNRAGLRDRAAQTADGRVVYVYGNGRKAAPAPDPSEGFSMIHLARFSPVDGPADRRAAHAPPRGGGRASGAAA